MSTRKEAKEERGTPPAPQPSPQTAATPVKSRSAKAGRNLPAAISVGVGFGVLLVLGLIYQPVFVAIATGAAALGAWEIGHVLNTAAATASRNTCWVPCLAQLWWCPTCSVLPGWARPGGEPAGAAAFFCSRAC